MILKANSEQQSSPNFPLMVPCGTGSRRASQIRTRCMEGARDTSLLQSALVSGVSFEQNPGTSAYASAQQLSMPEMSFLALTGGFMPNLMSFSDTPFAAAVADEEEDDETEEEEDDDDLEDDDDDLEEGDEAEDEDFDEDEDEEEPEYDDEDDAVVDDEDEEDDE